MSLYNKASIALIPSGTKASKLYSVLPANGNGDFTHSRGSVATRVNKDGIIESVANNVPRLDYPLTSGVVGDCPNLLLEPLRRNLFTDSDLSGLSPTTTGDGAATNTVLSNGLTGKKIDITSSGRVFYSITTTCVIGTQYTVSCYVENFVGATESNFIDITTGGNNEDFSTALLSNGRMQGTFTATATSVQIRIGIGTTSNRTGTKSAKIGGIQLEDSGSGSDATFATSLIQTSGDIVTRSADACNSSGSASLINSEEGTLFVEIAHLNNGDDHRRIVLSDGSTSNTVRISFDSTTNEITGVVFNGSNQCVFQTTSFDITNLNKVALTYKVNEFKFFVNGSQVSSTDTSGTTFSAGTLTELAFDNGGGGNLFIGKAKQVIVFKEVLSNSELTTLTTQ
tara:strand:- start:1099 stop:2289 length:1191 start_codon:yes stop_codon:yes gene_type:complete